MPHRFWRSLTVAAVAAVVAVDAVAAADAAVAVDAVAAAADPPPSHFSSKGGAAIHRLFN